MNPGKEWDNLILPQFDNATQNRLKAWRKKSLRFMWIGATLFLFGGLMIGIFIGGHLK